MAEKTSTLDPQNLAQLTRPGSPAIFNRNGISPQYLQQLLDQAVAHHRDGRKEEAGKLYRKVLDYAPNQPDALNLLGVLAAEEKLFELAIELMKRALLVRPKDATILNNLGYTLFQARRLEESRDNLERAIALKPDFDEAKFNLGTTMRHMDKPEAALALFREVWAKDSRVLAALLGTTGTLEDQGKFDEAEATAREVIARLPERAAGYVSLAHTHKFRSTEGILEKLERFLEGNMYEEEDKAPLHYSAGKICDDLKMYERAFGHFTKANQIANKGYDHKKTEEDRSKRKLVFSERFFRERKGWGNPSEIPVFVVGMPRSGTTLTEQILSAHPQVFGAGEIETMSRMLDLAEDVSPTSEKYPTSILKLTSAGARLAGDRYVEDVLRRARNTHYARIINKMPHNFEMLGLLALILPNAKVIHCRRNPYDTCLSCWTKNFNEGHAYNRSLTDVGRYYRGYYDLMAHWRRVLPLQILDVDYEDYTRDLESAARKIVDFVGLEWNPACMEFYNVERPVRTASQWQVRQPIYNTSVEKWQAYMPHLQPLIDAIGDLSAIK